MMPSATVIRTSGQVLDVLRDGERSKYDLAVEVGASIATLHRAFAWLRELGAPLVYDYGRRVWRLERPDWRPSLTLGAEGLVVA